MTKNIILNKKFDINYVSFTWEFSDWYLGVPEEKSLSSLDSCPSWLMSMLLRRNIILNSASLLAAMASCDLSSPVFVSHSPCVLSPVCWPADILSQPVLAPGPLHTTPHPVSLNQPTEPLCFLLSSAEARNDHVDPPWQSLISPGSGTVT